MKHTVGKTCQAHRALTVALSLNNLTLNRPKSVEIGYTYYSQQTKTAQPRKPEPANGITRKSSIQILCVTISAKNSRFKCALQPKIAKKIR